LTATVKDASGAILTGQSVTWASSSSGVATVSSTGLVSGVAAGSATITATSNGKQGQATVTVTAPAPSTSDGCPSSGYARLVPVSTMSQLSSAINAAAPGDQIRLAPGTYTGGLTISRNGTAAQPITLCGPRTAVLSLAGGSLKQLADWWVFRGFTVTNGLTGVWISGGHYNVVDSLLVQNMGNSGIAVGQSSTHNTIRNSTVRETGQATPYYGEGIYIGCGSCGFDPSDSNLVQDNILGPNIRAEHVQVVGGTTGNRIIGNVSNASGLGFDLAHGTNFVMWSDGIGTIFTGNTITNLAGGVQFAGMGTYQGRDNVFRGNRISGTSWYEAISINPTGNGNIVYCDNTASGGSLSNVACTP
jgi:Bacterial Ig-like domain (group 2)